MTAEQQEMLYIATIAKESGFWRVDVSPDDVIALLNRIVELEARIKEMRRKYEPTMAEQADDLDVARLR